MRPARGGCPRLQRIAGVGFWALAVSCLWGQINEPDPLRPATIVCRPAVLVDGHLVCGDAALAGLRTLCPGAMPGDGDAVATADGCLPGRMPGDQLLALAVTIDVNSASAAELEALPGIGPTLARRIVEGRPYRRVAELERVAGIGVARLAGMRPHVRAEIPEPRRAVP